MHVFLGETNAPIHTVIILNSKVEILSFFICETSERYLDKDESNILDISDVQLLNKFELKG